MSCRVMDDPQATKRTTIGPIHSAGHVVVVYDLRQLLAVSDRAALR